MGTVPTVRIDRSIFRGLATFDADRLRWLDEAAALGPIAGSRFGPVTAWVLSDAGAARTVLVTDSDSWTRPPTTRFPIRLGVGENLFTQSDRRWAVLQPEVAPAFRKRALDARLAGLDELIEPEVACLPIDTEIDLEFVMNRIALMVAAWVLLGEHLDRNRADELAEHQRHVAAWVGERIGKVSGAVPFAFGKPARQMREHRHALEAYADDSITRAYRRESSSNDVLEALLSARPHGRPLRADALRGHVLGLFFAGNETTAAALCWALVHAAHNRDEWARVRTEPERARPFIDETLRITPAVWGIPRTATRRGVTLQAAEHTLPVRRGQVVMIYPRAMNRDPATWPDPERFDPNRHLAADQEQKPTLIPFGLGPRGCIGQHVAMAEMTAILPVLARHGDVRVDGKTEEDASFALRVAGGLRGRFTHINTNT